MSQINPTDNDVHASTEDWSEIKPKVRQGVLFWPVRDKHGSAYRVEHQKSKRFFRVGYREYCFLSLLDGETTIPQACGQIAEKLGADAPDMSQAKWITTWALENDLIASSANTANTPKSSNRKSGAFNPLWIRIPIPGTERLIPAITHHLTWIFASPPVTCGLLLIASFAIGLTLRWETFWNAGGSLVAPDNWLYLAATWLVLKLVHELGHAIACTRFGGTVGRSGLALMFFAPMAYVDVTSCWRMTRRWPRIAVSAAGMYVELVIAAIAFWWWVNSHDAVFQFHLRNIVFAASASTLVCNANFLMKFDGYYLLSDLINFPNLYSDATLAVKNLGRRWVLGIPSDGPMRSRAMTGGLIAYGTACLVWKSMIMLTLIAICSHWLGGSGILIGAAIAISFVARNGLSWASTVFKMRRSDPLQFPRAALGSIAAIGVCLLMVFCLPLPSRTRTPAIVSQEANANLRCGADGWIDTIHVADGQVVTTGDLIVTMRNNQLLESLDSNKNRLKQLELDLSRAVAAQDHSRRDELVSRRHAVTQQIAQQQHHADQLKLKAHRDGVFCARSVRQMAGQFVKQGDIIAQIAPAQSKEVIAYVDQDQMGAIRDRPDDQVKLIDPVGNGHTVAIKSISPRASKELKDRPLAADVGGSLAAEPNSESDSVELLRPHFRLTLSVAGSTADQIPVGSRIEAQFGSTSETIYAKLRRRVGELLR